MTRNVENLRPLPPFIAAAVAGLCWPLSPSEQPPLFFEPLERMQSIRAAASTQPSSSTAAAAIAANVLGAIQLLSDTNTTNTGVPTTITTNQEYLARVAIALLLLGHGYTDEAHDLVSPLSWPRETPFSYGPPVALEKADSIAVAAYTHALVHRREGRNASEFGLTGHQNANYWTGASLRSGGEEMLPRAEVHAAVNAAAAKAANTATEEAAVAWCRETAAQSPDWEPRFLNELCVSVTMGQDTLLKDFAEQAAVAELKVLLAHVLQSAGFDAAVVLQSDGEEQR